MSVRFSQVFDYIKEKPLWLVGYKAYRKLRNQCLLTVRSWAVVQERMERRVNAASLVGYKIRTVLIDKRGMDRCRHVLESNITFRKNLTTVCEQIAIGQVKLFGELVTLPSNWQDVWRTDWRTGYVWRLKPASTYDHYSTPRNGSDVKRPWELGRLGFLQVPAIWAATLGGDQWFKPIVKILESWYQNNPIGQGIQWHPMECSMRALSVVIVSDLAKEVLAPDHPVYRLLIQIGESHGRYIRQNLEFSDIRGNHYFANLTALLLLGLMLKDWKKECKIWIQFAAKRLDRETRLQFSSDGVHFEKSIPYHRLVTELLILSLIARQRAGVTINPAAVRRAYNACSYIGWYLRPDGKAPLWGDNDEGRVFWGDLRSSVDHRGVLEIGARLFAQNQQSSITTNDLAGALFAQDEKLQPEHKCVLSGTRYFEEGGMFCARFGQDHFVADVGDVGLSGRGGHGHMDSLSFELSLLGQPIVIDPGSYAYTSDLQRHRLYRSTGAHNIARPQGCEMANTEFNNHWRIGNEALAYDIHIENDRAGFMLSANHDGFIEKGNVDKYRRTFSFDAKSHTLEVCDDFFLLGQTVLEQLFHLTPSAMIEIFTGGARVRIGDIAYNFLWGGDAQGECCITSVSEHYGHEREAPLLRVWRSALPGRMKLRTSIGVASSFRVTIKNSSQRLYKGKVK